MRALILAGKGDKVVYRETVDPEPAGDEVVVNIRAAAMRTLSEGAAGFERMDCGEQFGKIVFSIPEL